MVRMATKHGNECLKWDVRMGNFQLEQQAGALILLPKIEVGNALFNI